MWKWESIQLARSGAVQSSAGRPSWPGGCCSTVVISVRCWGVGLEALRLPAWPVCIDASRVLVPVS